ncbi:hypothetical protein DFH09DRAFT_1310555 [Mycena vulgaris]|nr:hypothetical protein DFH09DRAFT_1310555 [Mycena vulgaris]
MSQEDSLARVEDLWFPDANLHPKRSVISFHDMVAFPQPECTDGDTFDGNPVVFLHDSAADVEVFLRAVFDSSFFMPPPSPTYFTTVIGVMRLSHKYDVQYLFRRALSHLDSIYPTSFQEFSDANLRLEAPPVKCPVGVVTDLTVLRLASELDAPWFLPAVYYSICTYPMKDLFASGEPWTALGPDAQQTCLPSQVHLLRGTAFTHEFLSDIPSDACTSDDHCDQVVSAARLAIELCPECSSAARKDYTTSQQEFWNRMPITFGLPSWEELRNERRDAMGENVVSIA